MSSSLADSLANDSRRHVVELFARRIRVAPNGCWMWTGGKDPDGYGIFSYRIPEQDRTFTERAHRFAYRARHGSLPPELDHIVCDTRACVNPEHLVATTSRDNVLRSGNAAAVNARKTHCDHGHELSGENLRIDKDGRRLCVACKRRHGRTRNAKITLARQAAKLNSRR